MSFQWLERYHSMARHWQTVIFSKRTQRMESLWKKHSKHPVFSERSEHIVSYSLNLKMCQSYPENELT